MKQVGWKPLLGDKCLFVLTDAVDGVERIAGVAGLHGMLLIFSLLDGLVQKFLRKLKAHFEPNSGWENGLQRAMASNLLAHLLAFGKLSWTMEITMDQKDYTGYTLNIASWRATQSALQYLADALLFLGEINKGKVALIKVNELTRDMNMRRNAQQKLSFPHWPGVSARAGGDQLG